MALHAFPRRFRTARGAEITATFSEAELAGDVRPYGARALADVVVAGWTERMRTRPPLGQYMTYRLLDGRLDPQWHRWMFDDVRGRFGVWRCAKAAIPLIVLAVVFRRAGLVQSDVFLVAYPATGVLLSAVFTPMHRRRILRRHGYDPATLTWTPPAFSWATTVPRQPRATQVAPVAFTMAAALAVVAPFAVLASLGDIGAGIINFSRQADGQHPMTLAAIAVAVVVALAGTVGHRRIAGRLTQTVDESFELDLVLSDLPSAGAVSAGVMVLGLGVCLLPVAPLIVPLAYVIAAGAVPPLVVLGVAARRKRGNGAVMVWALRPIDVVEAPTT
jgi:hypothetical protein